MTTPEQQTDSAALEHFLTEFERVAAHHNEEPDTDDPEPDVT